MNTWWSSPACNTFCYISWDECFIQHFITWFYGLTTNFSCVNKYYQEKCVEKFKRSKLRSLHQQYQATHWCLPHFFHNSSYWRVLQGYYSTATEGKINLSLPKVKAAMNQLCTRGCLKLLSNVDWHLHILLGCNLAYFSIYSSQSVQLQFHFAFPWQYLIKPLKFTSCCNSILNKIQLQCSMLRGEIIQTFHVIFVEHFLGKYWAKSIGKWLISPFFGSFMIRLSANYQLSNAVFSMQWSAQNMYKMLSN